MRKLLLFLLFLFAGTCLFASKVHDSRAKVVALNWMNSRGNSSYTLNDISNVHTYVEGNAAAYYIVSFKPSGWVIVSGSDLTVPVLAYSTNSTFDAQSVPSQVKGWMGVIKAEVLETEKKQTDATKQVRTKWGEFGGEIIDKKSLKSAGQSGQSAPLLSTTWNQGRYYNEMAPYDPLSSAGNSHVWIGCVATAMSQVMKYWAYPETGMGSHSYFHPDYGTLSANFENSIYTWAAMPNNVTSLNTEVQQINYHAAVAVDMDFGSASSGAYLDDANNGLVNYFKYNNVIFEAAKSRWDDAEWKALLRREIDAGRPVIYSGYNASYTSGHAWVCDGYASGDYFHFNWGWSGTYNGNYLLSALNPGSYNFSNDQAALFSIEPVLPDALQIPYALDFETGGGALSLFGVAALSTEQSHTGTHSLKLGDETIKSFATNAASLCFIVPDDAELNFWVKRRTPETSVNNQQTALLMPQFGSVPLVEIYNGDYNDADWVNYNVDLSPYTGQVVRLLVTQQVNDFTKQQWTYIDDISVSGISNNLAPYVPSSPVPTNTQNFVDLNPTLRWNGGDPNGDNVTYSIYFGTQMNPPFVASGSSNSFVPPTLTHTTTYYWKVIADDEMLTSESPVWSFTTTGIPPEVGNCGVTNLTSTSATICGEIIDKNKNIITSRGICWTQTAVPSLSTEHLLASDTTNVFSCVLNNLQPYTTYNYRAFAASLLGEGYSPILTLQTLPDVPKTDVVEVKNILRSSAVVTGAVLNVNDSSITRRGVVWSQNEGFDPLVANRVEEEGEWLSSHEFQIQITGIPGPGVFYVRAFAENSMGTSFSDEMMFSTTNNVPFVDLDKNNSRGAANSDFLGNSAEQTPGGVICDTDVLVTDPDGDIITQVSVQIDNPFDVQKEVLQVVADFENLIVQGEGTSHLELSSVVNLSYSQWTEILKKVEYLNLLDSPHHEIQRKISVKIYDGIEWSNTATAYVNIMPVNDAPIAQTLPSINSEPVVGGTIAVVPGSWDDILDECDGEYTFRYWWQVKDELGTIEDVEADNSFFLSIATDFCGKMIRVVEEVTDKDCGGRNSISSYVEGDWVAVKSLPQTITIDPIPIHYFHEESFVLTGNSTSGLPLSFNSLDTNVVAISNDTAFIRGVGKIVITGIQNGNECYQPSSVGFKIVEIVPGNQEIIAESSVNGKYSDHAILLPARATSGLSLNVSSSDSSVAFSNGDSIFFNGAGATILTISQPGNKNYLAALPVELELTVDKGDQVITGTQVQQLFYGQEGIPLFFHATSLLDVEISSTDSSIIEILNDSLFVRGVGTASLILAQEGNELWNPATILEFPLSVSKGFQLITADDSITCTFGDSPFSPLCSATSGLNVSFVVSDTSVADVIDGEIVVKKAGKTSVVFVQHGNSLWEPAEKEIPLHVLKADQEITFDEIGLKVFGDTPFLLNGVASSGLDIMYRVDNDDVASVVGGELIIKNAGSATVTALQPGNINWNEAVPVSVLLQVDKASQTITSFIPDSVLLSDEWLLANVSVSSVLPVTVVSTNKNCVVVDGDTLFLLSPGVVELVISQAGSNNFMPAQIVDQLVVYEPVSVPDFSWSYDVYPNPSTGIFNVSLKENSTLPVTVSVSNLDGKKILSQKMTDQRMKINLEGYPSGIYFMRLETGKQQVIKKLMLESIK